jgi:hypothetical protein
MIPVFADSWAAAFLSFGVKIVLPFGGCPVSGWTLEVYAFRIYTFIRCDTGTAGGTIVLVFGAQILL